MSGRDNLDEFTSGYISAVGTVLASVPRAPLVAALDLVRDAIDDDRQIFLVGNGGSASTASHMAIDLMHRNGPVRGSARAVSLCDNSAVMTALSNDLDFEQVFSGQLRSLARKGDLLIIFSGSGRSANLIEASRAAGELGLTRIAFLGMGGGDVASEAEVAVVVPSDNYGIIESVHLALEHLIAEAIHREP